MKKELKTISFDEAIQLLKENKKVYIHEEQSNAEIKTRNMRHVKLGTILDNMDKYIFQKLKEEKE